MVCVWWQVQVQDVSKPAEILGSRDNVYLQTAASICRGSRQEEQCAPADSSKHLHGDISFTNRCMHPKKPSWQGGQCGPAGSSKHLHSDSSSH